MRELDIGLALSVRMCESWKYGTSSDENRCETMSSRFDRAIWISITFSPDSFVLVRRVQWQSGEVWYIPLAALNLQDFTSFNQF
jgi:hypothetical protein